MTDSVFHVFVAADTLRVPSVSCEYRKSSCNLLKINGFLGHLHFMVCQQRIGERGGNLLTFEEILRKEKKRASARTAAFRVSHGPPLGGGELMRSSKRRQPLRRQETARG